MKTTKTQDNAAKAMNAAQRLERATLIARSYRSLMDQSIAMDNTIGEEMWKPQYRIAFRIVRNMHTMRGITFTAYSIM